MRKQEKKNLLEKITVHIGNVIKYKNSVEGWTDKELAETYGVPQNRLTEFKNFKKYNRPISELFLAAFIGGGIVTVEDIIKEVDMNKKEKDYVSTFKFYADKDIKDDVVEAQDLGIDVHKLLQSEILRKKKEATAAKKE